MDATKIEDLVVAAKVNVLIFGEVVDSAIVSSVEQKTTNSPHKIQIESQKRFKGRLLDFAFLSAEKGWCLIIESSDPYSYRTSSIIDDRMSGYSFDRTN